MGVTLTESETKLLNAVIDENEIVYRDYVDISVAVATPKVGPLTKCLFIQNRTLKQSNIYTKHLHIIYTDDHSRLHSKLHNLRIDHQ